jgi:hypothetical protein
MATAIPYPDQDPFVIAAGAICPCEVPIRTIATSVSELHSLPAPLFDGEKTFYSIRLQQSSSKR